MGAYLNGNADRIESGELCRLKLGRVAVEVAGRLRALAAELREGRGEGLEALDRTLTVLEETAVCGTGDGNAGGGSWWHYASERRGSWRRIAARCRPCRSSRCSSSFCSGG